MYKWTLMDALSELVLTMSSFCGVYFPYILNSYKSFSSVTLMTLLFDFVRKLSVDEFFVLSRLVCIFYKASLWCHSLSKLFPFLKTITLRTSWAEKCVRFKTVSDWRPNIISDSFVCFKVALFVQTVLLFHAWLLLIEEWNEYLIWSIWNSFMWRW